MTKAARGRTGVVLLLGALLLAGLVTGGVLLLDPDRWRISAAQWNAGTQAARPDGQSAQGRGDGSGGGHGRGGGGGGGRHRQRAMGAPFEGPVAVTTAIATRQEVPVHVDGIGTVQAYNEVTVRVRVDGQIDRIDFTEGQDVKQGDVLAQIDPRPYAAALAQARAAQAKDMAMLADAKLNLQRDQNLSRQQYVSQKVTDTQKATVAQLEAAVAADQAAIDSASVQLGYTTVRAPIAGRTGIRLVDQGNIVHAADRTGIVIITQLQPISVLFTLPQQSLRAVNQALAKGAVPVVVLDMDRRTELQRGRLAVVDNQIDPQTGTYKLKATLPNADRSLWPGQFVNARVELDQRAGIVVPNAAIQRDGEATFVYVVGPDHRIALRPVKLAQQMGMGQSEQDVTLLESGLKAGERVVVGGQEGLPPGTLVTLADAAQPPPAGDRRPAARPVPMPAALTRSP